MAKYLRNKDNNVYKCEAQPNSKSVFGSQAYKWSKIIQQIEEKLKGTFAPFNVLNLIIYYFILFQIKQFKSFPEYSKSNKFLKMILHNQHRLFILH